MDKGKGSVRSQRDHPTDRSQVRILLCDNNAESCQEIQALLIKCSYQVAAVWSPIEVFDALNSQGPRADIILASVDLLMGNEARILRYIMCKKDLQQVPVITRDQVSITIKGVSLGATDYLVKPLHADELSSLWRHSQKLWCYSLSFFSPGACPYENDDIIISFPVDRLEFSVADDVP